MAEFKIEVTETIEGFLTIGAETEKEALSKAQYQVDNDSLNNYDNFTVVNWSDNVIGVKD